MLHENTRIEITREIMTNLSSGTDGMGSTKSHKILSKVLNKPQILSKMMKFSRKFDYYL